MDINWISVYRWVDAPKVWKDLSTNGGAEDWLAFVPDSMKAEYMPFFDEGRFGNIVDRYETHGGVVIIAAHA